MGETKIKKLEWGGYCPVPSDDGFSVKQRIAKKPLGEGAGAYVVQEVAPGGQWGWWNTWIAWREPDGVEASEEAAKAAAQADFEARIRSALEESRK